MLARKVCILWEKGVFALNCNDDIEVWTCDLHFYKKIALPTDLAPILYYVTAFKTFKPVTA